MTESREPLPTAPSAIDGNEVQAQSAATFNQPSDAQTIGQAAGTDISGDGNQDSGDSHDEDTAESTQGHWYIPRLKLAEFLMIILTALICWVTKQQNDIIDRQSGIIQRQLENNESLAHKQLRAYVFLSKISLKKEHENQISTLATFVNAGATAAHDLHEYSIGRFCTDKAAREAYNKLDINDIQFDFIAEEIPEFVAAGSSVPTHRSTATTDQFLGDEFKKHEFKDEGFWIIGTFGYRDIFEHPWTIKYLYRLIIPNGVTPDKVDQIVLQRIDVKAT